MSSKYRSDIDGLRAVAVIAVVLYHGGFELVSGGFVGVDVFFVISGYLITSVILTEIQSASFRSVNFYERRMRRLFPALYTVLLVTAVPAWFLLMPQELEDFGQSLATTAVFTSNFLFFTESGYFDGPSELKPLLHTWSLAIEEQYYLLFPAFLLLLNRIAASQLKSAVAILLFASLALSIWSTTQAPAAGFYLLPGRTWELMLGSLLAMGIVPAVARRGLNEILGAAGIGMILLAVFTFDASTAFPGLAAVLPAFGTALIIHAGITSTSTVGRALSLKPVVFLGLISYSLYLWHWPIFVYAKHFLVRDLTSWEATGLVLISIAVATLSWRYVEQPFRGGNGLLTRGQLFSVAALLTVVIIAIGLFYDESEGSPDRLPAQVSAIADVAFDKPVDRYDCEGIKPQHVSFERLCRLNGNEIPPTFIVWGDSHAGTFLSPLSQIAAERDLNGINATSNGCVPLLDTRLLPDDAEGECPEFQAKVFALIASHSEIDTVIVSARWSLYARGTSYDDESATMSQLQVGETRAVSPDENRELFERAWSVTLAALAELNRKVIVIGPIPEIGVDVPNVLAKAALRGVSKNVDVSYVEFAERNAAVLSLFESAADDNAIVYLPVHPLVCDARVCSATDEHGPLYFDDNHFSNRGADKSKSLLEAAL